MIWLRIGSEIILSHFVWDAKLRFLFGFSKSRGGMSGRCCLRKMRTIDRPGPRPSVVKICQVWVMSWWQLPIFIICVVFRRRDVLDLEMLSHWQLATLIIYVRFRRHDVSYFWMLYSEFELVIVKILSSATPPRHSAVTIHQVWDMRRWQLPIFIICFGYQRRDVSYLEMLSCWQLVTLIICVRFWRREVLDLKMLFPEVNWVTIF